MTEDKPLIAPGSEVVMNYTLSLPDGTVADASPEGEPLRFVMGDGSLVEGLELTLYGLGAGDTQRVRIDPQDAFGFPDPDNVHTLPRGDFPPDMPLEPGIVIGFDTPSGEEVPGTVKAVQDDEVEVDFNHPLAGFELTFEVEILSVVPRAAEPGD